MLLASLLLLTSVLIPAVLTLVSSAMFLYCWRSCYCWQPFSSRVLTVAGVSAICLHPWYCWRSCMLLLRLYCCCHSDYGKIFFLLSDCRIGELLRIKTLIYRTIGYRTHKKLSVTQLWLFVSATILTEPFQSYKLRKNKALWLFNNKKISA